MLAEFSFVKFVIVSPSKGFFFVKIIAIKYRRDIHTICFSSLFVGVSGLRSVLNRHINANDSTSTLVSDCEIDFIFVYL